MKKKILIEGMSCNHCVGHVKKALETLDNTIVLEVSLNDKYALVDTNIEDNELKEVVEEEGYDVIGIE